MALYRDGIRGQSVVVAPPPGEIQMTLQEAAFTEVQLRRALASLASALVEAQVRAGNAPSDEPALVYSPTVALAGRVAPFQPNRPFRVGEQLRRFESD